jgi:uncharacterized protein with ParB-like and HNH nuclease domain
MSGFEKPITIKVAVEKIDKNEYFLPAIQREFIWKPYRIKRLFDSLMRGYPIGSFLFWEVNEKNIKEYQFYHFLKNYHEKDGRHNERANLSGKDKITAILDGQQRLTSLFIGLKGTYTSEGSKRRTNDDFNFLERKLFINLLNKSEESEFEYDFEFLTEEERKKRTDEKHFWFEVGKILDFKDLIDVNRYSKEIRIDSEFATEVLTKLCMVININGSINFFLEENESLDKVLDIFIRVNSGGVELSPSDLLMSVAIAQWKEKDARKVITDFVDKINKIGNGFNIDKDFILKSCLVLSDLDIVFKPKNFTKDNMLNIERNWEKISDAIRLAFELLKSFGYSRKTLVSKNAVIPIAYYLYRIDATKSFLDSSKYKIDRKNIFKWLSIVLIKGLFGSESDNILKIMRDIINDNVKGNEASFPLDIMIEKLKGTPKSLTFDKDGIENLINHRYRKPNTFSVLTFLYPSLDYRNSFHQDHIYPKKLFTEKYLKENGIGDDDIKFFIDKYNCISNLQLLEGAPNQEKSDQEFSEWISKMQPEEKQDYMRKNYIPAISSYELKNFRIFIEEREKLMIKALDGLKTQ